MKTVEKLEYQERRKTGNNSTIGEHFYAFCPICGKRNLFWKTEVNNKDITSGTDSVCEHFNGFESGLSILFSDEFKLTKHEQNIFVDGVLISNCGIQAILEQIEDRREDIYARGYSHSADYIIEKVTKTNARLFLLEKYLKTHKPEEINMFEI